MGAAAASAEATATRALKKIEMTFILMDDKNRIVCVECFQRETADFSERLLNVRRRMV